MIEKVKISASEINRFLYCNYSWYYERVYGRKRLAELRRERFGTSGEPPTNFKKGEEFHRNYLSKYRRRVFLRAVIITGVVILLCILLYLYFYPHLS